jgi:hypothetical protein
MLGKNFKWLSRFLRVSVILFPGAALAVTGVNPSGVNVNATGVTSVFLTFQNLNANERPVDAVWCGEVTTTGVTNFDPCVPGTFFGRLPQRNNLAQPSGIGGASNLTDIMTIPASVARRAYQQAQQGQTSDFFYVRRFNDGIVDTYVTVTCRMAGGGARTPLALTEVAVSFDTPEGKRPVWFINRDELLPPFGANVVYNGAGRLKGRWEVVQPGDLEPTLDDLLTEASLPVEQRGSQRRYSLIDRFDLFLAPNGSVFIPGPDPDLVATATDGPYQILLRIEASAEREGNSDAVTGSAFAGGVAGFPMPILRFFVGTDESLAAAQIAITQGTMSQMLPGDNMSIGGGVPINFSWITIPEAAAYKLEVKDNDDTLLTAVVPASRASYTSPPWAFNETEGQFEWRVVALDIDGRSLARSDWRRLRKVNE